MYAKLFTSIYQGTLRGDSHGLLVFTNLLAHCDTAGIADIHPRAIAEEIGLTVEQVKAAIERLEAPDIESRTPDEEGRRIIRMDEHRAWGWRVVNYGKYRAIRNEEDRREQNRLAQERWRKQHKQSKPASAAVSPDKPRSAQGEGEGEGEERKDVSAAALRAASPPPPFDGENESQISGRAVVQLAPNWGLPEAWGQDAEALGWVNGRILKESERFRQYWVSGKGCGSRKSLKGWRQAWSNWLGKAERMSA